MNEALPERLAREAMERLAAAYADPATLGLDALTLFADISRAALTEAARVVREHPTVKTKGQYGIPFDRNATQDEIAASIEALRDAPQAPEPRSGEAS